ncbi:MAG TPA: hypothetical protein VGP46_07240 [Acidimicrobiales bacterium]|jgi:hypothetical protein|nr:hypothetical protein [Acidimicrobiales bacterium]
MTLSDYILDIALIGIVVLQIRGRRLTLRSLLLPLIIVAIVAAQFLRSIPTSGNDLLLIGGCTAIGVILGGLCALFTSVTLHDDGTPFAKAGVVAAVLWVLGVGMRFAFQLYATHGGGDAIGRFSITHHISVLGNNNAWVAALILMAIGEAVVRSLVLAYRGLKLRRDAGLATSTWPAPSNRAIIGNGDGSY